jgi:excisionase family DNA binding protein
MSAADAVDLTSEASRRKHIGYREAAELLSIPVGTLRSMVCRRQIPHVRISARLVVFDVAALNAWLERCTVPVGGTS